MVPVVLYDSYKAMNSNSLRKVTTEVHFLPPIPYSEYNGLKKPELASLIKERVSVKLEEIRDRAQAGKPCGEQLDKVLG